MMKIVEDLIPLTNKEYNILDSCWEYTFSSLSLSKNWGYEEEEEEEAINNIQNTQIAHIKRMSWLIKMCKISTPKYTTKYDIRQYFSP